MSNFKATLYGFDYYLKDGLFKDLELPEGLNKDVLIAVILKECGEMTPVFTDAEFMQQMIGAWSIKWKDTFRRWFNALSITYDPLNNYDRTEEWTTDTTSGSSGSSSVETTKSAYDSDTYTPYDKVSGTNSDNASGNEVKRGHTYGNIGVTTSQQMLQAELDIAEWNIYDHIKDLFMQEFCIMIY